MDDRDRLIERLRERATDPERRVDVRSTVFGDRVMGLDLSSLLPMLGDAAQDLRRVVAANQAGEELDPELVAKAEQIGMDMATPAPTPPSRVADADAIERAEAKLGFAFPELLRRLYLEVADGGFGPGPGLLSANDVAETFRRVRDDPPNEMGQEWPPELLPLVDHDGEYDCLDTTTGRVVTSDSDEVEVDGDVLWAMSFVETAPSLAAWLDRWLQAPSAEQQRSEAIQGLMVQEARRARAEIAAMTPEQRRAMGLPAEGWERIVWGGVGLGDDSEPTS